MKGNISTSQSNNQELRFAVLAADVVLWTIKENELWLRLIPVNITPHFVNLAGLPGGLISPTETAEQSVERLITAKAQVASSKVYVEQLYTFSNINRDPRGRVVAVAYSGYVPWEKLSTAEREDKDSVYWRPISKLPKLAYDHKEIVAKALERLQSRITYSTLSSKLVDKEFTLTELEQVYEAVLGKDIDKRNFRKKILSLDLLKQLNKERRGLKQRPAKLYSFRSEEVKSIPTI
jgi:8-oxo-dGTP diphosphatase